MVQTILNVKLKNNLQVNPIIKCLYSCEKTTTIHLQLKFVSKCLTENIKKMPTLLELVSSLVLVFYNNITVDVLYAVTFEL